jgi:hypothetical protein
MQVLNLPAQEVVQYTVSPFPRYILINFTYRSQPIPILDCLPNTTQDFYTFISCFNAFVGSGAAALASGLTARPNTSLGQTGA